MTLGDLLNRIALLRRRIAELEQEVKILQVQLEEALLI